MGQVTVRDAITQVARNMGLTNGLNMTPYSDDTVLSYLISAHELIREEHEWSEMIVWRPRVLDGVTGLITTLITDVSDWKDIRRIYHDAYQTPLPLLSSYINPLISPMINGYRGLPPEEDNTTAAGKYLVKFYPATLTGNVLFQCDRTIDFTNETTPLPIDWWLHVYYASWQYAVDDGTNAPQAEKYMNLAQKRLRQITARESSRPSFHQPNQLIPNDWWENDAPYS